MSGLSITNGIDQDKLRRLADGLIVAVSVIGHGTGSVHSLFAKAAAGHTIGVGAAEGWILSEFFGLPLKHEAEILRNPVHYREMA